MKMSDLVIIGGGGHAKVISDIAEKCGYKIVGFLDDCENAELFDYKRLGDISCAEGMKNKAMFIIAIGNNNVRKKIYKKYSTLDYATLIDPTAQLGKGVKIARGTVVMPRCIINANANIGCFCVINSGAIVEHDCEISEFTSIAPAATVCGGVSIGKECWIGAGSVINNTIKVCDDVIVGSGAVVVNDIKVAGTYIGVPVRRKDADIDFGKQ